MTQTGIDIQHRFVVVFNRIAGNLIFAGVGEVVAVDNADGAVSFTDELQRLIDILHFVVVRMWLTVWGNQSVDAEWPVIGFISKIAAIGVIAVALQSLVHPVPDGGTTDAGVSIDDIPVLLQVAAGVSHGVGIFAHHERLVGDLLGILPQVVGIEVTVVPDSRVAAVAIVEGWSSGVEFLYLVIHRLDVWSNAAFVTETPKNNARMVEIALHQ